MKHDLGAPVSLSPALSAKIRETNRERVKNFSLRVIIDLDYGVRGGAFGAVLWAVLSDAQRRGLL